MASGTTVFKTSRKSAGYRLAVLLRLILCAVMLLFLFSPEGRKAQLGDSAPLLVGIYALYSVALFFIGRQAGHAWQMFRRYGSWFDIACCTALTLLTGGHPSPFNFLFFFIIIDGASGNSFASGMRITLAAAGIWFVIALSTTQSSEMVSGIVSSAFFLALIGFIIAYRGGREFAIKRRLSLIEQIGALATPQIGLARSIGVSLELLRAYFDADDCILVMRDDETKETSFYKNQLGDGDSFEPSETPDKAFVDRLLSIPPAVAVIFSERKHWRTRQQAVCVTLGLNERFLATEPDSNCAAVGEVLDAKVYLSVPITIGRRPAGRIYIIRSDSNSRFRGADVDLVAQITNQLTPVIENARLIDAISSEAADDERRRIARDIHDSIIQPYMGIKFGLDSIGALLDEGGTSNHAKIQERVKSLGELSDLTIENLRGLVEGLADTKSSGGTLLPSIRRFAEKFSGATGIDVEIEMQGNIAVADRLASDIFQLAVEGLSNVRKHTASTKATLSLDVGEDGITLKIKNDALGYGTFRPRSITERVEGLRGTVDIRRDNGSCVVDINIPL
jgi:signal transduction histidine kinase